MSEVIHYLRSTLLPEGADLTDGQLLECFVSRHEPAALEALVGRHGPMVWGVCRRILQNHHDAEDAFQATFLVLVRKAASIRSRARVGNWLYGVAHQTALKARATRAKRKWRESQVTVMPEPAAIEQDQWSDLQPVLDQELSRMPDKYRTVIVLCDLEGKTSKEAARQLGLPQGTVASRLARARAMLVKRLARRGLAVSAHILAAVLSEKVAAACVPAALLISTIKAVTSAAAGQAATSGLISGTVAALTEGVIKAMLLNKLMNVMTVLLVVAGLSGGAGLIYHTQAAGPAKAPQASERPTTENGDQQEQSQDQSQDDMVRLQGTWRLVACEMDGLALLEGRPEIKDTRLTIDKTSVTMAGKLIHDPRIKKEPEDVKAVGKVRLDTKKNPKQVVFTWENNPWLTKEYFTQRGIYALDGDSLKLCFYFPGSDTKLLIPTEFSAKAGSKRSVTTWKRLAPSEKDGEKEPEKNGTHEKAKRVKEEQQSRPKDFSKIQPPGGVPLPLVRPGTTSFGVDELNKVRKRLEAVPKEDLEKWVVELERIMDTKLNDGLPSARQTCRTDFVIHLSVAFDNLKWNAKAADNLFQRAQSMPASEAKVWQQAFEALLRKKIGQTDTTVYKGGPAWAVPLVLIPLDALHEGQKYSVERRKKYVARLKQLAAEDVSLWKNKVDHFGGTELDAAVNIILLDDYFDKEKFQRDEFKAAVEQQEKTRAPAIKAEVKDKLQGTWQIVTYETDGLRVGEGRPELKDNRLVIEGDAFTLYYTPESDVSGAPTPGIKKAAAAFTLDAERTPLVTVLRWKVCPWNGKKDFVRKAILAVEGDSLKLCLSRKDDDTEAPSEFSAKAGSERLLWAFKRVPPLEKRGERKVVPQGHQGNKEKEKTSAGSAKTRNQAREGEQGKASKTRPNPVRVPDEAGNGKAKVTISFEGWEEGRVAPATFEIPITGPEQKKADK
jgi:RNA polymerase sigma factor (sigma-70 family)